MSGGIYIATKVLIINTVRFRLNGITSVILNYYRNMNHENMSIDFVVHNEISVEYRKELTGSGAHIYRLPRKTHPLQYQKMLKSLIRKNHYDVVHIHGNSAMMLLDTLPCKQMGVKKIIVHSHNTTCNHVMLHNLLMPIFRMTYTDALACGVDAGKWLYGNEPFIVLRNGIDTGRYIFDQGTRKEYRQKIGAGNKTVIGHIGNFIEQKNHTFILDTFAQILKQDPKYLLLLISDGALFDQMKEKAARMNIQDSVIFLGKTTEVEKYLQVMDLFILPSLYEGLPMVLIEAMAAGLPCFVSDKITKEVNLANAFSYLSIDDPQIWADAILHSVIDPQKRQEQSDRWCDVITEKKYGIASNAQTLRNLYMK